MNPTHEFPEGMYQPDGGVTPEIVPVEHEREVERTPIAIIDSVLRKINTEDWDGEDDDESEPKAPTYH